MHNNNDLDVQFLEEYLEQNADSIVFARLADAYLKMDKVDAATELCEDGITKHPYYPTGHFVLGKCYLARKQYELAEKEFKRVLLFDPKFLAAHKYYGDLMKEIGWENTCETSYKKILQIDPLDEVARSMAGEYIIEGNDETDPGDSSEPSVPLAAEDPKIGGMEPMPVSLEEEDMLFQADAEGGADTEHKIDEIEEQVTQIDEDQAEEFSYILDDIFKDEIVEEEADASSMSIDAESSEETLVDFQDDPENYLAQLKIDEDQVSPEEEETSDIPGFDSSEFAAELQANMEPEIPDTFREFESSGFKEGSLKEEPDKPAQPRTKSLRGKKDGDKIVTPTLGEIYAAQGQYAKAIDVFETLRKKHPDNEFYLKKIDLLKRKLAEARDA